MKNLLVVLAVLVAFAGGYFISQKYDLKIESKNGKAKMTVTPSASPTLTQPPLVGGDVDEHGCKASAGYSWCDAKRSCIRVWEEPCGDEEAIGRALAEKNKWQASDILVTITKFNGKFARGLVNSKTEQGGGGIYWAVKEKEKWIIAQDGNGIPDCTVLKSYQFPKEYLVGVCD
ncbi:MAG: hypothetical protein ACOYUB_04255 [Patescibacteria group bacterium]